MGTDPVRRLEMPFTSSTSCLLVPPTCQPAGERPPLLVALHGQDQSGSRHRRFLQGAVPAGFAAAFPDGFHRHEVQRPDGTRRVGHAWYLFTGDQEAFSRSLAQAEAALWPLVEAAVEELDADPERVVLAGFSQGAYLVHCAAVRAPQRVAGWIAQAGRLKWELLGPQLPGVSGKPVLVQHGRQDRALSPQAAEESARILREHGADVTLQLEDGGHEITATMCAGMRAWLEQGVGSRTRIRT